MTLSFTQTIDGKPNYFIEKIWEGLFPNINGNTSETYLEYQESYLHKFLGYWDGTGDMWHEPVNPKVHTIREDKSNRWKAGNYIHPVINNRTPNRFQFAPVIKCVSTQYFQILYENSRPTVYIGNTEDDCAPFYFTEPDEDVTYGEQQMKVLAINDGFDSIEDFFKYFNENFTGKIIHWTDLKY